MWLLTLLFARAAALLCEAYSLHWAGTQATALGTNYRGTEWSGLQQQGGRGVGGGGSSTEMKQGCSERVATMASPERSSPPSLVWHTTASLICGLVKGSAPQSATLQVPLWGEEVRAPHKRPSRRILKGLNNKIAASKVQCVEYGLICQFYVARNVASCP